MIRRRLVTPVLRALPALVATGASVADAAGAWVADAAAATASVRDHAAGALPAFGPGGVMIPAIVLATALFGVLAIGRAVRWQTRRLADAERHSRDERIDVPAALGQSIAFLRATLEATADGILVVDLDGRHVSHNSRLLEVFRITDPTILVQGDRRLLVHVLRQLVDPNAFLARLRELEASPELVSDDVVSLIDGRSIQFFSRPQRLGHTIVGRVWSFRDITDLKRAEDELRRSEERFRALIENISDSILIVDPESTVLYVASASSSGYMPHEMIGRSAFEHVVAEDQTLARAIFDSVAERPASRATVELRVQHRDGSIRVVEVTAHNLLDHPAVAGIIVVSHDITERKQVEEALQIQRTYFAELFESAPEAIVLLDENDRILQANHEFTRVFGYTREEAVGRTTQELLASDDVAEEARAITERVLAGEKVSLETVRRRKDGTMIQVSILGTPIQAVGEPVRVYGIYRDITERKRLEEQLRQSQRIEAVGRLAGGVAHDFNNLLTAIKGHTEMLLEELGPDSPHRPDLEEIDKAAERATSLTRQLLAFSRKQLLQPRILDLNDLIRDMERMLRRLIGEDIELVTVLDPALGRVKADPGQLEQVLLNLVVNSRDAMPKGGRIVIETRNAELRDTETRRHAGAETGRYVQLAVSDTGCGMDPEIQARIFEPFFTTKEPGKGTGLGLSTVYGIVKQSGGHIWFYSEVDQGTTFKVFLPVVDDVPETLPAKPAPALPVSGGGTILLVEDEDSVRALAHRILELRGYTVLAAKTGTEALQLSERHEGRIDLLVTDVVMPGIGGRELAERLVASRPGVRVLFMSGYTEDDVLRRGVLDAGAPFLEKPFSPTAFAQKVREVLDGAPGR